jgi:predicted Zn finger-like uncharacterized protein
MIITCPHCKTRYTVADGAIGKDGRHVQCAKCGNFWLADRASVEASPPPATPESEVTADPIGSEAEADAEFHALEIGEDRPRKGRGRKRGRPRQARARAMAKRHRDIARRLPAARMRQYLGIGSATLAALVVAVLFGSREMVVRNFPDLASLYGLMGMQVNVVGLEFSEVRTVRSVQDGVPVLFVEGRIRNVGGRTQALPPIRVSLYAEDGTDIYEWRAAPGASALETGETLRFETQLTEPPEGVARVKLRFDPGSAEVAPGTVGHSKADG